MKRDDKLDLLSINTIRTLSIDAVQKANSGHPGLPLGAAPMAYVLWQYHLKHNPKNPQWADRDRFVLSAGHGSMLLYSLMHLTGYESMPMAELERFRQLGSKTPGHPESYVTRGVEATTGPLGQGGANAVGMAIAERFLANLFNRPGHTIVDHHTFALVSDGDLMEGVNAEAASLAGHLRLGKLVFLYDDNQISLDGPTTMTFTEDVGKRYEAMGWHVQRVERGDTDLGGLDAAIAAAKADGSRPHLIVVRTTIGFGSPNKAGTSHAHGSPLGPDEVKLTKKALGWDPDQHLFVPPEARAHMAAAVERGRLAEGAWSERFAAYEKAHPALAAQFSAAMAGELPKGWDEKLPSFKAGDKVATRKASGEVLNAIASSVPNFLGGDADLGVSTLTIFKDGGSFDGQSGKGRNIHYGVREHGMGAALNGMLCHGGVRSFAATFFTFSDYMRPSVRLAALSKLPAIYVWTHDSVWLGEDGPTHQPVEHLMALRAMPNLWMIRPADAAETAEAWRLAMLRQDGPTGLVLTRQNLPVLDRQKLAPAAGVRRGAYVLSDAPAGKPDVVLIATGSEVPLALAAQELLATKGVSARVVSMPCWELFMQQDAAYRESVLPAALRARVSIEAGVSFGWERFVGEAGAKVAIDRFGESAPQEQLMPHFGFTKEKVAEVAERLVAATRR